MKKSEFLPGGGIRQLARLTLAAWPLVWSVGTAWAGDDDLFFGELPVVATVSRLPQPQADAPASVTVIDRDIIRAAGARDLSDVMRLVPGFQTFANNSDGPRVTYHGMADREQSSRIQVLVDGRSLFSPLFGGGVNWQLIPVALEDIERIEVIRGTNSTAQGSNAFQGVINIITVAPELARGVSFSASHGNQGIRDYSVRQGGAIGEVGSYRVRYKQVDDDGLRDRGDWTDSSRVRLFDLRSDLTLGVRDTLQINVSKVESENVQGKTSGNSALNNPVHMARQASTALQLSWLHTRSADNDWLVRYAYSEDVMAERYDGVATPYRYVIGAEDGIGRRHEIEAQNRLALGNNLRAGWGASYRHDEVYWPQYLYATHSAGRDVSRVFANLEWKAASWLTTNFGTAWEEDSLAGQLPSYRASASFHVNPENTIRLGASRGSRGGNILDYRGDGRIVGSSFVNGAPLPAPGIAVRKTFGNAGLGYERLDSLEIGYLGEWKSWRMSVDARVFWEHLPNRWYISGRAPSGVCNTSTLTVCQGLGTVDQNAPLQDVHIRGAEYQWRWQPLDDTRLMLSQAFVRISSDYLPGVLTSPVNRSLLSSSQLVDNLDLLTEQSAPRRSTSLLLMQKLPYGLDFSLSGVWVSRMKWTVNSAQNPYHRFDARLAYPFRMGAQTAELAWHVQSLNGAHGEYVADNSDVDRIVERRSWVSLRLDF